MYAKSLSNNPFYTRDTWKLTCNINVKHRFEISEFIIIIIMVRSSDILLLVLVCKSTGHNNGSWHQIVWSKKKKTYLLWPPLLGNKHYQVPFKVTIKMLTILCLIRKVQNYLCNYYAQASLSNLIRTKINKNLEKHVIFPF